MIRKIIKIDEEKCNGCGVCATACHEGAIDIIDGKAKLTRESYCDGLGDCLPACPMNAISFEEREAPAYDEAAVLASKGKGCPGSQMKTIIRNESQSESVKIESSLSHWPVQIKLAPVNAPYFEGADLLIAADCTAYAYGNFHQDFMKDRITLVGCSKLDDVDYANKLSEIFAGNNIKSVTVARMEVPCCGGIEYAVERALKMSGKEVPFKVVTITINGQIKK